MIFVSIFELLFTFNIYIDIILILLINKNKYIIFICTIKQLKYDKYIKYNINDLSENILRVIYSYIAICVAVKSQS